MGADEAQRPREAADGCSHRREGFPGAEGGSGKAAQGKGDWERLKVCWSRARGKLGNRSELDLRINGTVQVVAAICEQPRGTLHVTRPGALGLRSRKSLSRMLIHQVSVISVPEPYSLLKQATTATAVSLGAAPLPRAARNPQILLSCTHPLLSHPGRVQTRVMLHASQFKAFCIHHAWACSMPGGRTFPGQAGKRPGEVGDLSFAASRPLPLRNKRKKKKFLLAPP